MDRTCCPTTAPASTSPVKQCIVMETVANNDDDDDDDAAVLLKHIGKRVAKFWDINVFFGTVTGVYNCKEIGKCLLEIQINNEEIYDFNLAQVLDACKITKQNNDCNNDDEDDEPAC